MYKRQHKKESEESTAAKADGHGTEVEKHEAAANQTHGDDESHGAHESSFNEGFTLPGLLDLGVLLGFLSGFLLFVFGQISKAPLQPKNDPYYGESLHHHVM